MPRQKKTAGKQKATAEPSQPPPAPPRFASSEVEEKYNTIYKEMPVLPEKGFNVETDEDEEYPHLVRYQVECMSWKEFCKAREAPDEEIAREFYAALITEDENLITIRGTKVLFTAEMFNRVFKLLEVPHDADDYQRLLQKKGTALLNNILSELGKPGTSWTKSKTGLYSIRRDFLTPFAKIWFYFVRHSLMPVTHGSTITFERMLMVYCLAKGLRVNIGRVLVTSIRQAANKTKGCVFLPQSITLLCQAQGIPVIIPDGQETRGTITVQDLAKVLGPEAPSRQPKARRLVSRELEPSPVTPVAPQQQQTDEEVEEIPFTPPPHAGPSTHDIGEPSTGKKRGKSFAAKTYKMVKQGKSIAKDLCLFLAAQNRAMKEHSRRALRRPPVAWPEFPDHILQQVSQESSGSPEEADGEDEQSE